jgi:succinoglycan biosynthesis protein ExoA
MATRNRNAGQRLILPPLGERPTCSIVIPCFNEEAYVEGVVRNAMAQDYPADRLEILVVDGRSTDATRAIVLGLSREDPRVALLPNPDRLQSAGMNAGIKHARGDVIIRMDAHAEYAPDYVRASVAALRRTGALNVGGAARARHRNEFQRALCAALASPLGFGGSAYRDPRREGFVESVFNGAFRREAFEIVGLYDPEARTNEDAELNQRIIEAGGGVYLCRDVVAYYYPRASLAALLAQYFAYGQGRARTLLRRGRLLSIRPLVPCAAVTGFLLLAIASVFVPAARPILLASALLYAALVAAEAVRVARRRAADGSAAIDVLPTLLAIFPAMHAAHGLGFSVGLCRHARERVQGREPERLLAR